MEVDGGSSFIPHFYCPAALSYPYMHPLMLTDETDETIGSSASQLEETFKTHFWRPAKFPSEQISSLFLTHNIQHLQL